MMEDKTMEVQ